MNKFITIHMKKVYYFLFVALLVQLSCQTDKGYDDLEIPGLDVNNMDLSADPKSDFYRFANGGWLDKTEIPADRGRWGGFAELALKNDKVLLNVLDEAVKNDRFSKGSDEQKAVNFYSVGMDSLLAERIGITPMKGWFEKIDGIKGKEELHRIVADLHKNGYTALHAVSVFGDLMNSDINSFYIVADGLGLPNRDYYTKTDQESIEIREKYVAHLERMLSLAKLEEGNTEMANNIMAIETRMAEASKTPIELRDLPGLYNKRSISQLMEMVPAFDWSTYLGNIGADVQDSVIIWEPKFMAELNNVLMETPLDHIQAYLKWHVINRAATYLNDELASADFDFYGKVIRGTEERRPRWERVLGHSNAAMGEAIGKVYVADNFPPEAKAAAEEMVQNILKAFESRINNLEWMSDTTKEMALKKLSTFKVKIGYPNKWEDYSDLVVQSDGEFYSHLNNVENATRWNFQKDMEKIGEEVDKEKWEMNPQTVNAYYNPLNNEIVFPAAILQPPFYNYKADPAVNYGGIGAAIGHEISHGFDDQGSRFDANGNMINWWTDGDRSRFEERTKLLVKQYDSYEALDSVFVQGELTLGENIGDLGGLNAAYDGLQIHFQNNKKPGPIDGFTQEQRFFLNWATIWRTKYRDESLRTQILTDPHSPAMYRGPGPLENMEQFYAAFDVKQGDTMWKPDSLRVKIW